MIERKQRKSQNENTKTKIMIIFLINTMRIFKMQYASVQIQYLSYETIQKKIKKNKCVADTLNMQFA